MGMLTSASRQDEWAADPEALLLLSLDLGREEPRLFEEVLDWLLVNQRLISSQRLRNLSRDEEDRALAGAATSWLAEWRTRTAAPTPQSDARAGAEPLFLDSAVEPRQLDPAFLEHGFLKAQVEPARRSGHPDLKAPINFALRLRGLLGVGARAEVVRVLLTVDAPRMSLQAIAESSGYAKRNVYEAASSLRDSGLAISTTLGNELRFEVPPEPWLELLGVRRLPVHVDWVQRFSAYRVLLRWLRDPANESLSGYMLASEARAVLTRVAPDFRFAGDTVDEIGLAGEDFWPHSVSEVQRLLPAI